ncbi:hypothetical protein [Geodermatophilus sp. URMC 64]
MAGGARSRRPRDRGAGRAYPGWSGFVHEEAALSEHAGGTDEVGVDDAVLLFVGGPLDGRVEIRAARHGEPLPTITHVHLHGGPKVVHRYDLESLTEQTGVYRLRTPERRVVPDQTAAD